MPCTGGKRLDHGRPGDRDARIGWHGQDQPGNRQRQPRGTEDSCPPGTPVFAGDRIRTGADGSVGITLHDDTRLTAGPDSTLLITEFRFNPNTNEGSLLASLLKGTFSVITGLIAKHSPDNVKFKTPTMTLGIRGTEFLVDVKGEPD